MKFTLTPLMIAALFGFFLRCDAITTLAVSAVIAALFVGLMILFNTDCRN